MDTNEKVHQLALEALPVTESSGKLQETYELLVDGVTVHTDTPDKEDIKEWDPSMDQLQNSTT